MSIYARRLSAKPPQVAPRTPDPRPPAVDPATAPSLTRRWLRERLGELATGGRSLPSVALALISLTLTGPVAITAAQLAARLGLSRATVTRQLHQVFIEGGGLGLLRVEPGRGRRPSVYSLDAVPIEVPWPVVGSHHEPTTEAAALYDARGGARQGIEISDLDRSPQEGERGRGRDRDRDEFVVGGRAISDAWPDGIVGVPVDPPAELEDAIREVVDGLPLDEAAGEGVIRPAPREAWIRPLAGLVAHFGGGPEGLEAAVRLILAARTTRWRTGRGWWHYLLRSPDQMLRASVVVRVGRGHQVQRGWRTWEQGPATAWGRAEAKAAELEAAAKAAELEAAAKAAELEELRLRLPELAAAVDRAAEVAGEGPIQRTRWNTARRIYLLTAERLADLEGR